jgi:hypothetical protein
MAGVPTPPAGDSRPDVEELEGHLRDQMRRSPRQAWRGTKRSWSRSSAWAASTRCRTSSHASTPSAVEATGHRSRRWR